MTTPSITVDTALRVEEEPRQTAARTIRVDIQLLRALAILLVLLHHAHIPYLPGGFLGVDIFFVVSGYLMTGLIDEGLVNRRFTFGSFYTRRIRRLMPAAYATLTVTAIAAPFLVDSAEYRNFVGQLAGSFTFVANVVLWKQSDYFSNEAVLKPLLHMWSLAVEEQFYIVLPLLLFLCPTRLRLWLCAILTVGSAALCFYFVARSPSLAFYMLPTRAWELGVGAVVALIVRRERVRWAPGVLVRTTCAAILIAVPLLFDEGGHPGLPALAVCLATAVLMVPGAELSPSASIWRPFTAIGDRSYTLYLVHWPVFAFAAHISLTPVPLWVNVLLIVVCLGWMELQYRLVERRFRTFAMTRRSLSLLALVPLLVIGGSVAWMRIDTGSDTRARAGAQGLSPTCDYAHGFTAAAVCQSAPRPTTMVWGDSFAMAATPGIVATSPGGVIQATRSLCGPFLGIAVSNGAQYKVDWAGRCIAFNQSVLDHLAAHPEIRTVVLVSALNQYIPGAEDNHWRVVVKTSDSLLEQPQQLSIVRASLDRTVAAIRRLHRRIILLAPPPSGGFDTARCLDRARRHLPTLSPTTDCRFGLATYRAYRKPVLDFLNQIRTDHAVPVLSLDGALCGSGRCTVQVGGVPLYRDHAHLSTPGSLLLGRRLDWGHAITTFAS